MRRFAASVYHRSNGTTGDPDSPKTLEQLGISKDQSSSWQQLAEVPEEDFALCQDGAAWISTKWLNSVEGS